MGSGCDRKIAERFVLNIDAQGPAGKMFSHRPQPGSLVTERCL
jgi:hypothetical protein